MRTGLTGAVCVGLLLAGCGGSLTSPGDVADKLGCSGFHQESPTPPGVKAAGTCKLDGEDLALATFDSTDEATAWAKQVRQVAKSVHSPAWWVTGDSYAVVAQTRETQQKIEDTLH